VTTPVAAWPSVTAYKRTPFPAPTTAWREAEFCVIDLETTGLDPLVDEIISFAALQIVGGRLRLNKLRYQLIRPRRMPDAETIRIHGLRSSDLVDAPALSHVFDGLLEALTGKAMVAHVAQVERAFLDTALQAHGLRLLNPVIDTAALATELLRRRGQPAAYPIGLSPLARTLGLPVHRPHHADGDALTTAQIFLALATHLEAIEPQTVGSLQRHGNRAVRSVTGQGLPWVSSTACTRCFKLER
jgi:DNA polymerase-3 subunit epsilon